MVMPASEYELEGEYEFEFEGEWEGEEEGEYEGEEFFRRLAGLAARELASPGLRRVAASAARSALRGLAPPGGQSEYELEWEEEGEYEAESTRFANPLRRVYPDAAMEHLAHAAAEAESEAEAEAFIGALVPLAARLLPRAAPAIMRAAPNLVRAAAGVARTLRRSPTTRPLVRTIPTIVRRTAADIARQSARGRPVTARAAVASLARQTATVLGSPRRAVRAYRRARALDRRYHQAAPRAAIGIAGARRLPGAGMRPSAIGRTPVPGAPAFGYRRPAAGRSPPAYRGGLRPASLRSPRYGAALGPPSTCVCGARRPVMATGIPGYRRAAGPVRRRPVQAR